MYLFLLIKNHTSVNKMLKEAQIKETSSLITLSRHSNWTLQILRNTSEHVCMAVPMAKQVSKYSRSQAKEKGESQHL